MIWANFREQILIHSIDWNDYSFWFDDKETELVNWIESNENRDKICNQ